MNQDPKNLEQEAYESLSQDKFYQAFVLYQRAASSYKRNRNHKQAALCFASAASCWSKKSGEKAFYNAALSYQAAAREAEIAGDLEYASMLYKYAAINYERDREFINFSDCFYRSKECMRRFITHRLINPKKIESITPTKEERGVKGFIRRIVAWLVLNFSFLLWGHGERPLRTVYSAMFLVLLCALFYLAGSLVAGGKVFQPNFIEALYFSIITFTTVGYGDIMPLGSAKVVASIEALCGIFIIPILVISLTRKYLRI